MFSPSAEAASERHILGSHKDPRPISPHPKFPHMHAVIALHGGIDGGCRCESMGSITVRMGISAVQLTPDHLFGNASATAVWEAAPVRTINKRYGRERGHEATLAARLH
jgi:hypothetical protein